MIIIKTEKKYREELKEEYKRGYDDGISNHDLLPETALDTIETCARAFANQSKKIDIKQLNKAVDIVRKNYKLKPKEDKKKKENQDGKPIKGS